MPGNENVWDASERETGRHRGTLEGMCCFMFSRGSPLNTNDCNYISQYFWTSFPETGVPGGFSCLFVLFCFYLVTLKVITKIPFTSIVSGL